MSSRWYCFGISAALLLGAQSSALAGLVITTNQNGADAEVREEDINADLFTGLPAGTNRGANNELATRIIDTAGNSGDRTSAMYMKFDITGVTQSVLDNNAVRLRLHVRTNGNIRESERSFPVVGNTNNDPPTQFSNFNVYGLNNFALSGWAENTITWYNAPGITPDCMDENSCDNDPGKYNFNSDMTLLGNFRLQQVFPQNALPTGEAVDYVDTNGALKALIQLAKNAGQTHITLAVALGINGVSTTNGGPTAPAFINRNYVFTPKEMITMTNDTAYDADGGGVNGPNPPGGSPFSCQSATVCPGMGNIYNPMTGVGNKNNGYNSNDPNDLVYGRFSPKLIFAVPEPGSVTLLVLASIGGLAASGRRRK